MTKQKPIERTFPINQVNEIAEREALAKRYYRPVYTMHKWWARRLGSVFRAIAIYSLFDDSMMDSIAGEVERSLLYFEKDETAKLWELYLQDVILKEQIVVLDPMMGGGTSIIEALRLGANVIGCEINPVAWFIVKQELEPIELDKLSAEFERLERILSARILQYYKTTCPVCSHEADAMYYFWVKELGCVNCGDVVPLFNDYRVAASRSTRVEHHAQVVCSQCGSQFGAAQCASRCPTCGTDINYEGYHHVLCPECGGFFEVASYAEAQLCPHCGAGFVPAEGACEGANYTCRSCAQTYSIIAAISRLGRPRERLYGVEYYCPICDRKGYKSAETADNELYAKAAEELAKTQSTLPIPDTPIPEGHKTRELLNHGYTNFRDMFNLRQQLCLGNILDAIMAVDLKPVRESLLAAFSDAVNYNTILCTYNFGKNHIYNYFKGHEYHVPGRPVENNPWGCAYGTGSFSGSVSKVLLGKQWTQAPVERYVTEAGVKQKRGFSPMEGRLVGQYDELGKQGNAWLLCRSADYLPLADGEYVDIVITDPPYYDNLQYAELADFFYVWLRLALLADYPQFRAELTPKSKEVIVNPARAGKTSADDFLRDLEAIFRECYRVLRDDGLMVFTYHHREDQAWSAVLGALLNAGFYITAAWPIHSEMSTSTHIYQKKNISYDTIIVARKRAGEGERISWRNLEDQIYARATQIVQFYVHENGKYVSDPDMGVIAQAKCLELYSQHYPNVMEGGEPVSVQEAVKRTTDIVTEQLIEERFQALTAETDTLSALYLLFLADRDTITYNTLDKWLRGRGADVEDFVDRDLLRQEGSMLRVTKPRARLSHIEGTSRPLAIDGAHYLYSLIKHGDVQAEARAWADRRTIAAAKELHKVTGDDAYERIAEYLERLVS